MSKQYVRHEYRPPRGPIKVDLLWKTIGDIKIVKFLGVDVISHKPTWLCKCECGNYAEMTTRAILCSKHASCGCKSQHRRKYEESFSPKSDRLYRVWSSMKYRCSPKQNKCADWKNYGGRGIRVCEEWQEFEPFRKWAISHGYDYNADPYECTIDRIDVNGNYEPSNCRFVDMKTQIQNRRPLKRTA